MSNANIAKLRAEGEKRLAANHGLLSPAELNIVEIMRANDQMHVFARWDAVGVNDAHKHAFLEQLAKIDALFSIQGYTQRAQKLLAASRDNSNPYADYEPHIPTGTVLETKTAAGRQKFDEYDAIGMREIGRACFVLVAGGLGERLSYPGIKVGLPIETTTMTSYLKFYITSILALQARANKHSRGAPIQIPFAIMTSGDTDKGTRELLAANNNFGMAPGQLTIMTQDKVPAMSDASAHFVVEPKNPYVLMTKPHGHGDVHLLLHKTGLAHKWVAEGRNWLFFLQDTNCLSFRAAICTLGVSAANELEVNSVAVARKPGDAAGGLIRLVNKNDPKDAFTINVEYNQIASLCPQEPLDEKGFSVYPGNINLLCYMLPPYAANLKKTGGIISEFVNPKYANAAKTQFKKDTRLECMMQDYPKVLRGTDARVSFTRFERWTACSTVKNSLEDARQKQAQKLELECAASGEAHFYRYIRKILHDRKGVDVSVDGTLTEYEGIRVPVGARIVPTPSFGVTAAEIASKFCGANVHISERSTLVLDGENITIKSLNLDGALVVRAPKGTKVVIDGLTVKNNGWQMVPVPKGKKVAPVVAMRGYTMERRGTKEVFGAPTAKL